MIHLCTTSKHCKKTLTAYNNKYVDPAYRWAEIYAGRLECCTLVCHGEYADGTDRQMDRRTDVRPLH